MNLICPHCQKAISIPDEKAGQLLACPICKNPVPVPALTAHLTFDSPELPEEIPLVPLPPAPEKPENAKPSQPALPEDHTYQLTPEPPKPPPPPKREKPAPTGPEPRAAVSPALMPTPAPPTSGYERLYGLHLRQDVVGWIAPISLIAIFLLLWFPWVGSYPGGYGVYTQNAFGAWVGRITTDQVGEQVMNKEGDLAEQTSANWFLMTLYLLLTLVALLLAVASIVSKSAKKPLALPPAIEQIWPWRTALVGVLSGVALIILLLLLWSGLGLENGVKTVVDQKLEKDRASAKTGEEIEKVQIKRGLDIGWYNLRLTGWLWWVIVLQIAATAGAGLELWLEKRGSRPPPLIQAQC